MTLKKYTISLDGLLAHENIIFKLICSVSERTKNRSCAYNLQTNNNTDIHIDDIKNKTSNDNLEGSTKYVWITDNKDEQPNTISRPLIATRVLHTLDNIVKNIEPLLSVNSSDVVEVSAAVVSSLSEEEASELAIVHDEVLENPANQEDSIQVTNPELTLIKNDKAISVKTGKKHHVLVVDDSPSVRKQLELELELFDVTVDFADTAQAALSLLKKNSYDLALLDVVLPDKDGFLICKHIKLTSKNTVVIMLTGKATQADKIKGSLAGCNDYLIKPVGRMTFQNSVKNYILLKNTNTAIEA